MATDLNDAGDVRDLAVGASVDEDLARSAVEPVEPLADGGWLVSARDTDAELRLVDCSPVVKILLQAPPAGPLAGHLAVPFGRAELFEDGFVVACTAPGEWLLLCPSDPREFLDRAAQVAPDHPAAVVDLTHGRTLLRLTGRNASKVLAGLTAIDLSDQSLPSGVVTSTAVAGVRAVVVRDDLFADEAGLTVDSPVADGDGPEVPSYLLCCDRSAGRHLYERLLEAGRSPGLAEEGYLPYRERRADI